MTPRGGLYIPDSETTVSNRLRDIAKCKFQKAAEVYSACADNESFSTTIQKGIMESTIGSCSIINAGQCRL